MPKNVAEFASVMRHARAALDLLSEFQIPPTPPRFTVAYVHHSGEMSNLTATINRFRASQSLNARAMDQIYDQFFGYLAKEAKLREASEQIETMITEVVERLDSANVSVKHYGSVLADFSQTTKNIPQLDQAVASVLDETQLMATVNRRLETHLRASSLEMRLLRDHVEELEREVNQDALTGIANRKRLEAALREAIFGATEESRTLSLLMIDIDHFKDFNDTHGHQLGDQVLRLVARYITECTRGSDIPARYGGEEFCVVLPNTDIKAGARVAENIRTHVSTKKVVNLRNGNTLGQITLSIGVAEYRFGESATELVHRADEALYLAKARGRNRVITEATLESEPS